MPGGSCRHEPATPRPHPCPCPRPRLRLRTAPEDPRGGGCRPGPGRGDGRHAGVRPVVRADLGRNSVSGRRPRRHGPGAGGPHAVRLHRARPATRRTGRLAPRRPGGRGLRLPPPGHAPLVRARDRLPAGSPRRRRGERHVGTGGRPARRGGARARAGTAGHDTAGLEGHGLRELPDRHQAELRLELPGTGRTLSLTTYPGDRLEVAAHAECARYPAGTPWTLTGTRACRLRRYPPSCAGSHAGSHPRRTDRLRAPAQWRTGTRPEGIRRGGGPRPRWARR